jgi:hypothetical protein
MSNVSKCRRAKLTFDCPFVSDLVSSFRRFRVEMAVHPVDGVAALRGHVTVAPHARNPVLLASFRDVY